MAIGGSENSLGSMQVDKRTSAYDVQDFIKQHDGNVKADKILGSDGKLIGYQLYAVDKGPGLWSRIKNAFGFETRRTNANKAFSLALINTFRGSPGFQRLRRPLENLHSSKSLLTPERAERYIRALDHRAHLGYRPARLKDGARPRIMQQPQPQADNAKPAGKADGANSQGGSGDGLNIATGLADFFFGMIDFVGDVAALA